MKKELIVQLHSSFEQCMKTETEGGTTFWLARDLQPLLGYERWENFAKVIEKAKTACSTSGYDLSDHFLDSTKMVDLGSGAQREIEDVMLSRYACYLIAQNGDPTKEPVAFAQTYFAVQTRRMEVIEQRLEEMERLEARKKLTESEKQLGHHFREVGRPPEFCAHPQQGRSGPVRRQDNARHEGSAWRAQVAPLADFPQDELSLQCRHIHPRRRE